MPFLLIFLRAKLERSNAARMSIAAAFLMAADLYLYHPAQMQQFSFSNHLNNILSIFGLLCAHYNAFNDPDTLPIKTGLAISSPK